MSDTIMRTAVWRGLNRMPYIEDGQMRSMKNLSSDAYPYLTTRKGREEYKLTVYVPGVAGDGYLKDAQELPEENLEEYAEKIVCVTENPESGNYEEGEFYHRSGDAWVKGINNEYFKGAVEEISSDYKTSEFEKVRYPYADSYYKGDYNNHIYKYVGENNGKFEKGKTYQYKLRIEAYWREYSGSPGSSYKDIGEVESANDIPEPTEAYANSRAFFRYLGESTEEWEYRAYYVCYLKGYGYWEEISDVYELASEMTNKDEGINVRYIGNFSGSNVPLAYYTCERDFYNGDAVYFYTKAETFGGEYITQTELPEASEEHYKKTFYSGTKSGAYYICEWDGEKYVWSVTQRPIVEKNVSFVVWLTEYMNVGLTKIYEIGALSGKLAVLFLDGSGNVQLAYENKLFPVNDVSEEPGKKLLTMGNKLIVGECGSYLYRDKETKEIKLFPVGKRFSRTVSAESIEYADGKYKHSFIETGYYTDGEVKIVLYAPKGQGYGYEDIYNGLVTVDADGNEKTGVDFKLEIDGNTFYLQSIEGCKYEPNKLIGGTSERNTYADVLTIKASGMREAFSWSSEKADADITFASTASYLPDTEVWKKRLWGYTENYLQGTVQDVFDELGQVDWTTGDNTYTEAISQPIWQGGDITGLAALSEALILFKEDSITVFSGNYPAIMTASTIPSRGLSGKDRDSVSVANEAVYYLNRDGVYRFGGGTPQLISGEAKIKGTEAVGASDGRKYWLSIKEADGSDALYVFDINLGMWHKEDDTKAVSFTCLNGKMCMATEKQIYILDAKEEAVEWEAELWYDEGTYKLKKYKGFEVRGNLGECEVYLKADDGEWQAYALTENKLSIKSEPFMCRELSIKIKGRGICEIKSLDRTFEVVE